MENVIKRIYGVLLLMSLASCLFVSCSDDVIENGNKVSVGEMGNVTFQLAGMSGGVSTRGSGVDTVNVNFNNFAVKVFVFRDAGTGVGKDLQYYKEQEVSTSLVTITGISKGVNHAYVFVAVPLWAKQYLELKCYPKAAPQGITLGEDGTVTQQGTNYDKCYIPVFDEPEVEEYNNLKAYAFNVRTHAETGEDFKIYAWATENPVSYNSSYTPDRVILAPQFGKVRFEANDGQKITSCDVYSNIYRFYMSQVVGLKSGETTKKTVENGIKIEDSSGNLFTNDFLANYENGNRAYITKTFGENCNSYEVYMPCTTLGSEVPTNKNELANTFGTGTAWEGSEGSSGEWGWSNPTSVTINSQKLKTKKDFPIFCKRTTILGIKDDNTMTVRFEDGTTPGLGLDDDSWDGIN